MAKTAAYTILPDPQLLNAVEGLQLVSRVLSEELLAGANVSRKTGVGMEFSQYRSYQPGDDLRLLDWKLFGRTERYYVRQAVIYSNIHVRFILDNTASMNYEEEGMSKRNLGSLLIATLSHLAYRSGDQFTLSFINGSTTEMAGSQRHLNRILYLLNKTKAEKAWPSDFDITRWSGSLPKELIILVTDLYQEENEIEQLLKKVKMPKNEVIIFQISGEKENSFDFKKPLHFRDLETNNIVKTDPVQVRQEYISKREIYFQKLQKKLNELQVPIYEFPLNASPALMLRKFLTDRSYLHL